MNLLKHCRQFEIMAAGWMTPSPGPDAGSRRLEDMDASPALSSPQTPSLPAFWSPRCHVNKRQPRYSAGTFAGKRPPKNPGGLAKFLVLKEAHFKKQAEAHIKKQAERVANRELDASSKPLKKRCRRRAGKQAAVSSNPTGHGPKHPLRVSSTIMLEPIKIEQKSHKGTKRGTSEWHIFVKQNFKGFPSSASFGFKIKELSRMWSQRSEAGSLKDVANVAAESVSEVEYATGGTHCCQTGATTT